MCKSIVCYKIKRKRVINGDKDRLLVYRANYDYDYWILVNYVNYDWTGRFIVNTI